MDRLVVKEPYFFKDKDWYYYDYEELKYKLTDKATEKAKNSYSKFYEVEDEDIESSHR